MELVIPSGTTAIPDRAYEGRTDITSVVLPDTLCSIGEWAFKGCTALTEVTFESRIVDDFYRQSIAFIGTGAFYGCTSLTLLKNFYSDSFKTISPYTFYNCKSLTKQNIPTNFDVLRSIGHYAFYGCESLVGGVYSYYDTEVTTIGDYAFYGSGIDYVNLVGNTIIGNYAFANSKLKTVELYNTSHIGDGAFGFCRDLKEVKLGQALKYLGAKSFIYCSNLPYLFIPHGVAYIGDEAFNGTGGWMDDEKGLFVIDFSTHSIIPILEDDSGRNFGGGRNYVRIVVPDSLYGNWKVAPEWNDYEYQIVKSSLTGVISSFELERLGPPRIRFNIHDKPFIAEEGMTWREWVNSKYNDYALAGTITKEGLNRMIVIDDRTYSGSQYAYAVNWPTLNDVTSIYNDNIDHEYSNALPYGAISPDEKIVDGATYYSGFGKMV